MSLSVLFENKHFIAVDKPAGWLSVPSRLGTSDERPVLGRELEKICKARIFPVHRLDLEVTGAILFAKSAEAHKLANNWFEQHSVIKTYQALTEAPAIAKDIGKEELWESCLVRGKKRTFEAAHGKNARTLATLKGTIEYRGILAAIWQMKPLTGRSHQLRFELFKRQLPIIGDTLYGSKVSFRNETEIALRSVAIDFQKCTDYRKFGLPDLIEATAITHDLPGAISTG